MVRYEQNVNNSVLALMPAPRVPHDADILLRGQSGLNVSSRSFETVTTRPVRTSVSMFELSAPQDPTHRILQYSDIIK